MCFQYVLSPTRLLLTITFLLTVTSAIRHNITNNEVIPKIHNQKGGGEHLQSSSVDGSCAGSCSVAAAAAAAPVAVVALVSAHFPSMPALRNAAM